MWGADDSLKAARVDVIKMQQRVNEIAHHYDAQVAELKKTDQEICQQEHRLDHLNQQIDCLHRDAHTLSQDLHQQKIEGDGVHMTMREIRNQARQWADQIDASKSAITCSVQANEAREKSTFAQRKANYDLNDANLALLR